MGSDANTLLTLAQAGLDLWIGMVKSNGQWSWSSGYPCDDDCSSLKYWISIGNQPDGNGNCASIGWIQQSITNFVDDTSCSKTMNFACDRTSYVDTNQKLNETTTFGPTIEPISSTKLT